MAVHPKVRAYAAAACLGGVLALLSPVSAHADEMQQFAGSDRFSTAAWFAYAAATEADRAPTAVVIANGQGSGVDALSASYLAGQLKAPILLTTADHVPEVTTRAVEALDPDTIYVVGGEASVHEDSLVFLTRDRALVRVAGPDRYATSVAVWDAARAAGAPAPTEVFVARGDQPAGQVAADALAAGPAAYSRGIPILLSQQYVLPEVVRQRVATTGSLQAMTMLGGVQTVGIPVAEALLSAKSVPLDRIAGSNRSDTAGQLTRRYGPSAPTAVTVANGYTVDALGAAAYAGATGQGILLAASSSDLGSGTGAYLAANAATLQDVTVAGGSTSVGEASLHEITRYASKVTRSYQDPVAQPAPWRGEDLVVTADGVDPVEARWYFHGWNYPVGSAEVSDRDRFPDDGFFFIFLSRLSAGEQVTISRNPDGSTTFASAFTLSDETALILEVDLDAGYAVLGLEDGREVFVPFRTNDDYRVAGRAVSAGAFFTAGNGEVKIASFDSQAATPTVLAR